MDLFGFCACGVQVEPLTRLFFLLVDLYSIEKKLAHPFIEAQKKDGRKRLTKIFYNGGFGGKDIAGGEASEWIATGRADGSVARHSPFFLPL